MTSDKLAAMEAREVATGPRFLTLAEQTALVNIAKAAQDIEARVVEGPEWNVGEVFNSAGRLRAALSVLDGDQ